MKLLTPFIIFASLLVGTAAWAKPIFGISLQPVLSISKDAAGTVTIVGNMPGRKQVNQARFPASADTLGCQAIAEQAAKDGTGYTIFGEASDLYAEKGKFTMEFSTIQDCYKY